MTWILFFFLFASPAVWAEQPCSGDGPHVGPCRSKGSGFMGQSSTDASAQTSPGGLIIRIYDYAGVSERILSQAQAEAAKVYERIGVDTTWLRCTSDPDGMRDHPCNKVRGSRVLGLRLLPSSMEPKQGLPKGIFGFALLPPDGRPGSYANLYSDNVRKLADGRVHRLSSVLGHMLAHEIGHLLLGIGSHSRSGLMKIPWGPKELTLADRGGLGFSKREIRRIAKNLEMRAKKTEASD